MIKVKRCVFFSGNKRKNASFYFFGFNQLTKKDKYSKLKEYPSIVVSNK